MALNLRQKQTECIIRMLNLNEPLNPSGTANEEVYKILIYDRFCQNILAPLFHLKDLRKHGVTLPHLIDTDRGPIHDVPAVYFVQPTTSNLHRIIANASRSLYDTFHLNFSSSIPRKHLEDLASGTLKSGCVEKVAKVYDQYLEFVTLEDNLFSLAQQSTYVQMNDPSAGDKDIEEIIERVASGLFCVLVTLVVVPVIRCPRGGPAEMVASLLDQKLRDHLLSKNNLFTEGGGFMSSFQRPLLCIFDRNFDLSVGIQHDFRYKPLVHDVPARPAFIWTKNIMSRPASIRALADQARGPRVLLTLLNKTREINLKENLIIELGQQQHKAHNINDVEAH